MRSESWTSKAAIVGYQGRLSSAWTQACSPGTRAGSPTRGPLARTSSAGTDVVVAALLLLAGELEQAATVAIRTGTANNAGTRNLFERMRKQPFTWSYPVIGLVASGLRWLFSWKSYEISECRAFERSWNVGRPSQHRHTKPQAVQITLPTVVARRVNSPRGSASSRLGKSIDKHCTDTSAGASAFPSYRRPAQSYITAEGLNPKGTDQLIRTTRIGAKVLPLAAKHPVQLYVSGSAHTPRAGALAVSYLARATLVRNHGATVATVAALLHYERPVMRPTGHS